MFLETVNKYMLEAIEKRALLTSKLIVSIPDQMEATLEHARGRIKLYNVPAIAFTYKTRVSMGTWWQRLSNGLVQGNAIGPVAVLDAL